MKVCKFGGTSMANAQTIKRVIDVINTDKDRRYIVVSAPGKRFADDEKVTDMLYACCDETERIGTCKESFEKIKVRFLQIARELNVEMDIETVLDEVRANIEKCRSRAYAASRGEYLSAKLLSSKMGVPFVDTQEIIKFNEKGELQTHYTLDLIRHKLENMPCAVLPGFYGSDIQGNTVTFSRGGSDISGALVARAVNADVYENWTDVDGFLAADPRIVDNPDFIDYLSYKELRELSYMGAEVMHPESILPVSSVGIPINIKNTFNPEHPGTMIVAEKDLPDDAKIITGVAGKKGLTIINIEKDMMNSEIGFGRKVLSVLEYEGIPFEHIPSGVDTLSVVLCDEYINGKMQRILAKMQESVNADNIELHSGLSLIAVVGHNMSSRRGTAARVFKSLSECGVNVRMIDQGSSELNIILGVNTYDYEKSINAIYHEFL